MLGFLRDKIRTFGMKARYERLVQERVMELVESDSPKAVSEDPGRWSLLGGGKSDEVGFSTGELRTQVRKLVRTHPHARNVLRLLEIYVVGPELKLVLSEVPKPVFTAGRVSSGTSELNSDFGSDLSGENLVEVADVLWREFLRVNSTHYSYREHAKRTWRDGECFVRKFSNVEWPPQVRFVDPEQIGATADQPDSQGIVTSPTDVEQVISYLLLDGNGMQLQEEVSADEILHTKIGVDSNEKRGVSYLASLVEPLESFDSWMETELLARKLQASVVLWRKVQGSASQVAGNASAASDVTGMNEPGDSTRRERVRPGTILTTSAGTDVKFLQPDTNFGDAVPLGRTLLLCAAAGAGLPEFMLTSDASNGNFSSTMVAEGPAVKLFEAEQHFFTKEFERLWRWVMQEAIDAGLLQGDFFERVRVSWSLPSLVARDRVRDRLADVRLVEAGILSKEEVARREGVQAPVGPRGTVR